MTRDEALAKLRALRPQLEALGFRHVWLFGSVARDEAGPDSDVDLLVEVDEGRIQNPWHRITFAHEANGAVTGLIGRKVDLTDRDVVHRRFVERIGGEIVPIY